MRIDNFDAFPHVEVLNPPGDCPKVLFSLGICAMASKVASSPMRNIVDRILSLQMFRIVIFSEKLIFDEAVENWPPVDCLIAFYSTGYPLQKVISYVKLTRPIYLNDLNAQNLLRKRPLVLEKLVEFNIPTPRHIVVDHIAVEAGQRQFFEFEDYIVYENHRLDKPFIEKPEDADDHNNYVYYPLNTGGGCKKLFRKIGDRSSKYYPELSKVRRDGVYVYEEFLSTFGTDIKVYTVGPMFAHAEARKSPTLDGKVLRTVMGKEERYAVLLTEEEKLTSYKVVEAFDQTVCGFDILRTPVGGTVVCDVNGWSFVKGNAKYYDDAAHIIHSMFLHHLRCRYDGHLLIKGRLLCSHLLPHACAASLRNSPLGSPEKKLVEEPAPIEQEAKGRWPELRTVVVVMRHGDRSPKQKMKFLTRSEGIIDLYRSKQTVDGMSKVVKLISPGDLLELKKINEGIIANESSGMDEHQLQKHVKLDTILSKTSHIHELNRKVQLSIPRTASKSRRPEVLMVVVKWGGELTPIGLCSAEDLGHSLRLGLYPADEDGDLRLHSTFRHDFKIYTSDEGRCQLTAAAFTKGFLDLEGDLPPILVQMVVRDAKAQELFAEQEGAGATRKLCKAVLGSVMNMDAELPELCEVFQSKMGVSCPLCKPGTPTSHSICESAEFSTGKNTKECIADINSCQAANPSSALVVRAGLDLSAKNDVRNCVQEPTEMRRLNQEMIVEYHKALEQIGNPKQRMKQVYKKIKLLETHLLELLNSLPQWELPTQRRKKLESILMRWRILANAWDATTEDVDATKIPELYDNARYDTVHHKDVLTFEDTQSEAYVTIKEILALAEGAGRFVSALEYGISAESKLEIGRETIPKLLAKISDDVSHWQRKQDENIVHSVPETTQSCNNNLQTGPDVFSHLHTTKRNLNTSVPREEIGQRNSKDLNQNSNFSSPSQTSAQATMSDSNAQSMCSSSNGTSKLPEFKDEEHIKLKEEETEILGNKGPWRMVRSRFYTASASHIMSLLNVLSFSDMDLKDRIRHRLNSSSDFTPFPGDVPVSASTIASTALPSLVPNSRELACGVPSRPKGGVWAGSPTQESAVSWLPPSGTDSNESPLLTSSSDDKTDIIVSNRTGTAEFGVPPFDSPKPAEGSRILSTPLHEEAVDSSSAACARERTAHVNSTGVTAQQNFIIPDMSSLTNNWNPFVTKPGDAPYLSHLVFRVWQMNSPGPDQRADYSVEMSWHPGPDLHSEMDPFMKSAVSVILPLDRVVSALKHPDNNDSDYDF